MALIGPWASAKTVEFDTDGMPLIDGRRTFLHGTFRDPSDDWRDFSGVLQAGFNLTHDYYFESQIWGDLTAPNRQLSDWIREAGEYLDLAGQAGVGVFLGMPRYAFLNGDIDATP